MPRDVLPERAADQRAERRAEIDAHVENAEGAVATGILGVGIQRADLRRDVRLEHAVAEDQDDDAEEERGVIRDQQMAGGHHQAADDHRLALSQPAVRDRAAEDRRQIAERRIDAVDLRRQRLVAERAEDPFEKGLDLREAPKLLRRRLEQEQHVQHQQRAVAVIRVPFAGLGGKQHV